MPNGIFNGFLHVDIGLAVCVFLQFDLKGKGITFRMVNRKIYLLRRLQLQPILQIDKNAFEFIYADVGDMSNIVICTNRVFVPRKLRTTESTEIVIRTLKINGDILCP